MRIAEYKYKDAPLVAFTDPDKEMVINKAIAGFWAMINLKRSFSNILIKPLSGDLVNLKEKIDSFRELERNWDSYDADPISAICIEEANRVNRFLSGLGLWQLGIPIHVFPMRDGGIQFEIDHPDHSFEIEVHPNGLTELFSYDGDGEFLSKYPMELQRTAPIIEETEEFDYA
ncbi:MAG: hypothetical protein JKY52_06300 [Flavobacteriales bacterium]|nr:hypothetical protein [Flavobacteriales bacterium]